MYSYKFIKGKTGDFTTTQVRHDAVSFKYVNSSKYKLDFLNTSKWINQLPVKEFSSSVHATYNMSRNYYYYFTQAIAKDYSKITNLVTPI